MGGITTSYVLDGGYDVGLAKTTAEKSHCTILLGGKNTAKDNEVEFFLRASFL